jgi:hypothetical protein
MPRGVVMSAQPTKAGPAPQPPESIEQRLRRLESQWRAETGNLSSSTKIIAHPAFQQIIALGREVVPLILRDLEERPRLWVWALPGITGANPVPESDRGNIAKMSDAWLKWGKASALLSSSVV